MIILEQRTENNKLPTMSSENKTPSRSLEDSRPQNRQSQTEGKYDLETRLLEFASAMIDVSESLPASRAGNHVARQLLRSATSPYGNDGEAHASDSAEEFIHKTKVCLKELREAHRWGSARRS